MAHKEYTVKQGDCISSIAYEHGFFPDTIWNDSKNSSLKQKRKDSNVLLPGDVVYIRDKEQKEESCSSEKRHRFRKKGVPAEFVLQLLEDDEPRAGVDYTLEIDGQMFSGKTDSEGKLMHSIPPDAKKGNLVIDGTEEHELELGELDPVTEERGLRARLENLGFIAGAQDSSADELKEAIEAFQQKNNLNVTGQADDQTRKKLLEIHGC